MLLLQQLVNYETVTSILEVNSFEHLFKVKKGSSEGRINPNVPIFHSTNIKKESTILEHYRKFPKTTDSETRH